MKNFLSLFALLFALSISTSVFAQYDDVYYDPSDDAPVYTDDYNDERYESDDDDDDRYYSNDDRYDDYDYVYSSRIRRFHRPVRGFGYYSNVYVDRYFYDWTPGVNIYVSFGNPFWSYNPWRPWRPWRNWGWQQAYYNPWGFNSWNANPWAFNPYGFNPTGFGFNDPFYGAGFGNSWCPSNGYFFATSGPGNSSDYYYGPRRNTSSNTSNASVNTNSGRIFRNQTNGATAQPSNAPATIIRPSDPARPSRPSVAEPATRPNPSVLETPRDETRPVRPDVNTRPTYDRPAQIDRPAYETPRNDRPSYERPRTSERPTRANPNAAPRDSYTPKRKNKVRDFFKSNKSRSSDRSSQSTRPSRSSKSNKSYSSPRSSSPKSSSRSSSRGSSNKSSKSSKSSRGNR